MITVYSQPDCPHCDRVKRQLIDKGRVFEEINVQRDDAALKKIREDWGYTQVPVVEYQEDTILNPNPEQLDEFLQEGSVFDEY